MNTKPYLSIIIPAYNEAGRLDVSLKQLDTWLFNTSWPHEVIVVANGCSDGTADVVTDIAEFWPQLRLVEMGERKGKGLAVRTGMLAATGRYRYMCDADLSSPPEEIRLFLDAAQRGAQVVIGNRNNPRSKMSLKRRTIGRIFNQMTRLILPGIPDTQCGFKLFTGPAAEAIFSRCHVDGWAFDVEALKVAKQLGIRIHSVPVFWEESNHSKIRLVRDSLKMMGELIAISRI